MQDEIIKHTKKAYNNMKDPSKSVGHRILEVVIEVCIIVFAVSLSIWLHGRSEHAKEQAEVKEFLIGLKKDMTEAIDFSKENVEEFKECKIKFSYLASLNRSKKPDPDSLNKYYLELRSNPLFFNKTARYEGFKSSGKLEQIENKKLLADILDYYNQVIPLFYGTINAWNDMRHKLHDFSLQNLVINEDGTDNRFQIITMPYAHNLCVELIPWDQLFDRYQLIITSADTIIREIDEDYK